MNFSMDFVKMIEIKGLCHWLRANGQFKEFFQDIWYIFYGQTNQSDLLFKEKAYIKLYLQKSQ